MRPPSVSPLDTVLTLMRRKVSEGEGTEAAVLAKVAAPFLHGRAHSSRISKYLAEAEDDELDFRRPAGRMDAAVWHTEQAV